MYICVFVSVHMCVYTHVWRLELYCSVGCLVQSLWGTGSLTEPESYQLSFIRQASQWARGSAYLCLAGMYHHNWYFTCMWGVWTQILMLAWQTLYRLSHISTFQLKTARIKRNAFGEAENRKHFVRFQCFYSYILITHMLKWECVYSRSVANTMITVVLRDLTQGFVSIMSWTNHIF